MPTDSFDTINYDVDGHTATITLNRPEALNALSPHMITELRAAYGEAENDDIRLEDWVRREAWGHHACGTCRMGKAGDTGAVVDGDFRVRGVANLRVVDASVFPKIPGFFIVTSVYMVAEKAAEVIRKAAGR